MDRAEPLQGRKACRRLKPALPFFLSLAQRFRAGLKSFAARCGGACYQLGSSLAVAGRERASGQDRGPSTPAANCRPPALRMTRVVWRGVATGVLWPRVRRGLPRHLRRGCVSPSKKHMVDVSSDPDTRRCRRAAIHAAFRLSTHMAARSRPARWSTSAGPATVDGSKSSQRPGAQRLLLPSPATWHAASAGTAQASQPDNIRERCRRLDRLSPTRLGVGHYLFQRRQTFNKRRTSSVSSDMTTTRRNPARIASALRPLRR